MRFQLVVRGSSVGPRARRLRAVLQVAVVAGLLGVGCQRQVRTSTDITLTHEITPQPVRVGPARITLSLKDAAAQPVAGAHVTLEGDMSHLGMAPVFGEASEVAPGSYQGRVEFAMAGDWVILVHATLANGQRLERQIDVKGVEGK